MLGEDGDNHMIIQELLDEALKCHNAGAVHKAQNHYFKILQIEPNEPDANHFMGVAYHQLGQNDQALKFLEKAVYLKPNSSQAFNHYGCALLASRQINEAEDSFRKAIKLDSSNSEALFNLGNSICSKKILTNQFSQRVEVNRAIEAVSLLNQAISQQPDQLGWKIRLADALISADEVDKARQLLDSIITIQADLPEVYFLRASLKKGILRDRDLQRCLILQPSAKTALNNLAFSNLMAGRVNAVLSLYKKGIITDPFDAEVRWGLATGLLANGRLKEGWQAAKWRHLKPELYIDRKGLPPEWDGKPLKQGKLFVFQEQGIGDELRFASCFGDLPKAAKSPCVIETDPRLAPLFSRSFPEIQFIDKLPRDLGPPVSVDFEHIKQANNLSAHCALADLALHLRPTIEAFPQNSSYLKPDPSACKMWRERLNRLGSGLKVGFCWQTALPSKMYEDYFFRIQELEPVFAIKNINLVNLQYTECENELKEVESQFGISIYRPEHIDMFNELDDVAALIHELDVVIGPMTSVISMAGAVGTRCFGVSLHPDWTSLGTDKQLWTPEMTCFYRGHSETWAHVIKSIASRLC
ncbi:MAG: hypothetical protein CMM58_09730 [Rhodospirillaceae bacterium]|nr:hypothetical protein [Rhodospirillaceae bacterium]